MTRDEMKAFFELVGKVNEALGGLPYRDADLAMHYLKEMTDIVGDQLPGGYCGTCPQCEEVKGEDEMVDCGDERICQSCVDQWNKPVTPLPPRVADGPGVLMAGSAWAEARAAEIDAKT